jgi:hypothetical protein
MAIVTVGIDLAKNVFAVHGVDETGKAVLVRPEVPRAKLMAPKFVVPRGMLSSAATTSSVRAPRCLALLSACSLKSGVLLILCICSRRSAADHPLENWRRHLF